jgi:hypothetical protein
MFAGEVHGAGRWRHRQLPRLLSEIVALQN